MMDNIQIIMIVLGAMGVFVLFLAFVVWLIAQLSGWSKLAETYLAKRLEQTSEGRFQIEAE